MAKPRIANAARWAGGEFISLSQWPRLSPTIAAVGVLHQTTRLIHGCAEVFDASAQPSNIPWRAALAVEKDRVGEGGGTDPGTAIHRGVMTDDGKDVIRTVIRSTD